MFGTNTLSSFPEASVTKKKTDITLTPDGADFVQRDARRRQRAREQGRRGIRLNESEYRDFFYDVRIRKIRKETRSSNFGRRCQSYI